MNICLKRIRTVLNDRENEIIEENNAFIDEINNLLFNDDLLLVENDESASISLFFVETGGTEYKFLDIFDKLNDPILLLSNGKNNSLAACFEIKTYCNQHNKQAFIITGKEENCAVLISKLVTICKTRIAIENKNLGVIGEPSAWLIASRCDYQDIKKIFNINMIDISMDVLFKEIDKKTYDKIPHESVLRTKYKDYKSLEDSFCVYGALKRIIDDYQLSGLTIRCFDLLGKYKSTACLALALLNEEGIVCSCEGDVPSLLTMHVIHSLTGGSSFQANPSILNQEDKTIMFAHCTLPLNMTSEYELDTHFESDLGVAIKGEMPLGEITVCKIFINKDHNLENSIALPATIKENNSLKGYCRTQITVQFDEYQFLNYLKEDFGNHIIITYGNIVDELYALLAYYQSKAL